VALPADLLPSTSVDVAAADDVDAVDDDDVVAAAVDDCRETLAEHSTELLLPIERRRQVMAHTNVAGKEETEAAVMVELRFVMQSATIAALTSLLSDDSEVPAGKLHCASSLPCHCFHGDAEIFLTSDGAADAAADDARHSYYCQASEMKVKHELIIFVLARRSYQHEITEIFVCCYLIH